MAAEKKSYPRISKAKHDRIVDDLKGQVHALQVRCTRLLQENHDLTHTPEIKADTEAAFQRGEAHQRTKFKHWLIASASQIDTES